MGSVSATLQHFTAQLIHMVADSAPYVLFGFIIAALIREFIPSATLVRSFGSRGILPLLRAVGIGMILPLCSCGVIPVGVGAHRSGAARGTTLSFMTAAPALSPVAILLLFSLLGFRLALLHVVSVIVGSIALGAVGNWLLRNEPAATESSPSCCDDEHALPADELVQLEHNPGRSRWRDAMRWLFWDFGPEVSFDMLVGLAAAALILTLVPADLIALLTGSKGVWALLLVLVAAIPVYTCIIPAISLMQQMLLLGTSPGAAVAFLIGGPATNLGEMNAIRRQMGSRTAAYYAVSLVLVSVTAGLVMNYGFYADYEYRAHRVDDKLVIDNCVIPFQADDVPSDSKLRDKVHAIALWHWPFALIMGGMMVVGTLRRGRGWIRRLLHRGDSEDSNDESDSPNHPPEKPACCQDDKP